MTEDQKALVEKIRRAVDDARDMGVDRLNLGTYELDELEVIARTGLEAQDRIRELEDAGNRLYSFLGGTLLILHGGGSVDSLPDVSDIPEIFNIDMPEENKALLEQGDEE